MGLRAGVSDLCLPVRRRLFADVDCVGLGYCCGLYLELKALDGRLTREQKEFLAAVSEQGYFACACFGADAAIDVIGRYMAGKRMYMEQQPEGVKVF